MQKRKVRSPTASDAKRIFHKNMELLSSPYYRRSFVAETC